MNLIAIETSEPLGTLAAMARGNLLAQVQLDPTLRTAQSLAPGLQRLLQEVGWRPRDLQVVAVTIGPGSFTGLRIGVTAAKVLAYSVGADLLGVDTLEAIAAGCPQEVHELAVAVDAQRGELVAGTLHRDAEGWLVPSGPWELLTTDAWLASLPTGIAVAGPVLRKLGDRLPGHVRVLEPQCWAPTAAAVARLAARHYAAGQRDDVWSLVPKYYRRSAAEEKHQADSRRPGPASS